MKILKAGEMRAVDRACIEQQGISGLILMENASLQVFAVLESRFPRWRDMKVTVVCGKGNNGGDGLAAARHIAARGGAVRAILMASAAELKGDALVNLEMMMAAGVEISEATDKVSWRRAWSEVDTDLVIDAIFGTGLTTAATGLHAIVIEDLNSSALPILSIDVPSGLSSDTGEIIGPAIRARHTVALQTLKHCHVFLEAAEFCGEVVVVPIGIPPELLDAPEHQLSMLQSRGDSELKRLLGTRRRGSHKGSFGHALVVAGSIGKTGAAIMTGLAALRAGAGLVTVATPRSCLPIVASAGVPELMTEPVPETDAGTLGGAAAAARILELVAGKDTLIIGPGLSTHPATIEAIRTIIARRPVPVVLDADGGNAFAGQPGLLKSDPDSPPLVITPHPGEFVRLTGASIGDVLRDRVSTARRFATENSVYVVLKGYRTLIACPEGDVFVNPTGNPGMASGGAGDILTGLIGGILCQGHAMRTASKWAVFLHGLAGDLGAAEIGEEPLIATDLLHYYPAALKKLREQSLEEPPLWYSLSV